MSNLDHYDDLVLGGSCPNVACLPSKNVIYSARVAALCRRGAEFGIGTGPVSIDMRGVVRARAGGLRTLTGARIFLDVGTHATIPDVAGLSDAAALTHIEALELDHVPEHLIVPGGGYIRLEFAQPMRRFGARVTVLERGPHVASCEDPDVATVLEQQYSDEGIEIMLLAETLEVTGRSGQRVSVRVSTAGAEQVIEGSDLLVATGRMPNTRGIGLDVAGVELDERGYIKVNDRSETSPPDVSAEARS